eukprot:222402-Chlamydomonas_euryale.AAC.3
MHWRRRRSTRGPVGWRGGAGMLRARVQACAAHGCRHAPRMDAGMCRAWVQACAALACFAAGMAAALCALTHTRAPAFCAAVRACRAA